MRPPRVARPLKAVATVLLAATALVLGSATAAMAADSPSPSPTPSGSASAAPVATAQIWIRVASDKSNVAGVTVDVTGPKSYKQSFVTGDDGKALVSFARTGEYTFKVDTSTIPEGKGVPAINPLKITVSTGDDGDPAYFLLTPGGGAANPTSSASPSPGGSSSSSGGGTNYASLVPNLIVNGIIVGLLLALASIGVSLIYGTTGLSNFAHGELVTFGSLTGYVLATTLHTPWPIVLLGSFVLGGVFGFVQDLGLWRPLRRKGVRLIPLMIVSIGLSLALRYLYQFIFGPDQLVLPISNAPAVILGPVRLRAIDLVTVAICIVMLLLVAFLLLRTRLGKATRAVADNKPLAAASGINVERVIRIVWIGAGALAGLAGALFGYHQTVRWDTGASILLLIFASVTLGGFGTAFGGLVGSLIIGLMVQLSTLVLPANVQNATALAVMILILLIRPQGILGRRERIG